MKVGIITTSRADFGIYTPLINALKKTRDTQVYIFAGGMHTAARFGYSITHIKAAYPEALKEALITLVDDDSPQGLSSSMGFTTLNFGNIWEKYVDELDLVFVLGDRFEMFAATASLVPFNFKIAHLHGGETTLGAIDHKFRDAITAMSDIHFTSHPQHARRVEQIAGSNREVYPVGSLGVDAVLTVSLYAPQDFFSQFNFDIDRPFVLMTYHPETVSMENRHHIQEVIKAIQEIELPVLCTLPNADTEGSIIRDALLSYAGSNPTRIKCFENLGQKGYLTAMKYCTYMLGNTSSGIIEAGAFKKPVVNIGDRQKGRVAGANVIHVPNVAQEIVKAAHQACNLPLDDYRHPYGDGSAATQIVEILQRSFH